MTLVFQSMNLSNKLPDEELFTGRNRSECLGEFAVYADRMNIERLERPNPPDSAEELFVNPALPLFRYRMFWASGHLLKPACPLSEESLEIINEELVRLGSVG